MLKKGVAISPLLGDDWRSTYFRLKRVLKGEEFQHWFRTFSVDGKAPEIGDIWRSLEHAETLKSIANTEAKSFYQGEIAEKIAAFSREYDGFELSDLAEFTPEWVEPISVNYRGHDVWELPPNTQGIVALQALKY